MGGPPRSRSHLYLFKGNSIEAVEQAEILSPSVRNDREMQRYGNRVTSDNFG